MPYTEQKDRLKETVDTKGDLNQKLTAVINDYINEKGLSYNNSISDVMEEIEDIILNPESGSSNYHYNTDTLEGKLRAVVRKFKGTHKQIRGAGRACQMEFYRRMVVPYENTKMSINGDVYGKPEKV